jgi:transcriptional regulator of heat shock response
MEKKAKITQRQARILAAIVKEYTANPEPVGSETLEKSYSFGLSSATIRNDMKELEREGFIVQPHTSAGRVPTDEGYRYFITQLMKHAELSARERTRLLQEVKRLQQQHYELGRSIARLLASSSESAAFALLPEAQSTSGFSNIIASDIEKKDLKSVADFLDNLESTGRALVTRDSQAVQTFIGKDSPIPISEDVSMLVSQVKLPDGRRGVVGIVGSKRMKYAKNISLLEYVSKLISGGALLLLIFIKL